MNNQQKVTQVSKPNTNPPKKDIKPTATLPNKTLAEPINGSLAEGLNLMPKMTEEQKAVETKKSTFNIGFVLSFIALVALSLIILAFNIVSKQMLNQSKEKLHAQENTVHQKIDLMISNDSIVDRVLLYEDIRKNSFSHKEVVDFIQSVVTKTGNIELRSIEVSDNLTFSLVGSASSLEEVSKLWYLLGVSESIETVNLESVGKTENGARFTFEGKLVSSKFIKNT